MFSQQNGVFVVQLLTYSHIVFGTIALIASTLALLSKVAALSHRLHIVSGFAFVIAMTGIFATAVPLSIIHPNLFLRLIAIFSLYLALSGWRFARNRSGETKMVDYLLVWGMTIAGVAMIIFGGFLFANSSRMAVVISVFGIIGVLLSQIHRRSLGRAKASQRIVMHLTLMLGGTVAAWTALTVTQVTFDPPWVPWLAPTAIFLPIIVTMRRKEKRKLADDRRL